MSEYSVYLNKGYPTINESIPHQLASSPSILFVNQLEYIEINKSDFQIADTCFLSPPSIRGVGNISLPEGLTQEGNNWKGYLDDYTNIQTATFSVDLSNGSNQTVELYIIPVYFTVTDFIMENSITVKVNFDYVMQLWKLISTDPEWIYDEVYPRYYFKDGTPEGLSIDENSGEITGSITTPQTYTICWEIPSFREGYIQVGSLENYYTLDEHDDNFPSFICTTDITISPKNAPINKYSEYILNNKYKYIIKQDNQEN